MKDIQPNNREYFPRLKSGFEMNLLCAVVILKNIGSA